MTISYGDHFWKVFFVWRGSLWKTIYKDLAVFLLMYFAVSLVYRTFLNQDQRVLFEKLVPMFDEYTEHIPLTFMLGFYVGMVVKRWWDQFQRVLWPDNLLYWISAYIRGIDEESRMIRRTLARYVMLTTVMGWRSISTRVLKRFPTVDHVLKAGLMTDVERRLYEAVRIRFDPHKQWFIPLNWCATLMIRAYEEERISHVNELRQLLSDLQLKHYVQKVYPWCRYFIDYRNGFMQLYIYDWINIPLVYTQVAVVATYGYFAMCLIGRQFISPIDGEYPTGYTKRVDMYFPFFTVLQFLFYVGWLKVGEDLMNPFGEDDEDFEFNYLLDRHVEMSFVIVDDIHMQAPQPPYPDVFPIVKGRTIVPHTKASKKIHDICPHSHVRKIPISEADMKTIFENLPSPRTGVESDISATGKRRKGWLTSDRKDKKKRAAAEEHDPLYNPAAILRENTVRIRSRRNTRSPPATRRMSTNSTFSTKQREDRDTKFLINEGLEFAGSPTHDPKPSDRKTLETKSELLPNSDYDIPSNNFVTLDEFNRFDRSGSINNS